MNHLFLGFLLVIIGFLPSCASMSLPKEVANYKTVSPEDFTRSVQGENVKEIDVEVSFKSVAGAPPPIPGTIFLNITDAARQSPVQFNQYYLNERDKELVGNELASNLDFALSNKLSLIKKTNAKYKLIVLYDSRKFLGYDQFGTGGFYSFLILAGKVVILNTDQKTLALIPYTWKGKTTEIIKLRGDVRRLSMFSGNIYREFRDKPVDNVHIADVTRSLAEIVADILAPIVGRSQ